MGRLFFAAILALVGILYLWAAFGSVSSGGLLANDAWLGAIIFLVIGIAAAAASVNLLREKRR